MITMQSGLFNLDMCEVVGTVSSFDCYEFEVDIEIGDLKARVKVPMSTVETWDAARGEHNDLPSIGDKVLVKLR